jgi:hypothetical protein
MIIIRSIGARLAKLWHGQYSVTKALWGFLVLGTFIAPFVASIASLPFYFTGTLPMALPVLVVVYRVVFLGYLFVSTVGAWRSADALLDPGSYRNGLKIACAKLAICVWVIVALMRFAGWTVNDIAHFAAAS